MRPEFVVYVASEENAKAAIEAGADAVAISYRNTITYNSPIDYVNDLVNMAHKAEGKLYLNLDVFAHDKDIQVLEDYLRQIDSNQVNVDAIIVQDPGVFSLVQRMLPNMPIHIDQLVNVTNETTALMWKKLGVKRVSLANVLSIERICEVAKKVSGQVELEVAVAGIPCISYSGRNLLSGYKAECRISGRVSSDTYSVEEEQRPGMFHFVTEDAYGSYIYDSKEWDRFNDIERIRIVGISSIRIDGSVLEDKTIIENIKNIKGLD